MNIPLLNRLFLALAAGDSLGSTSEFIHQSKIPALFERLRPSGWPFRQVGGGSFDWPPGAPTDDTEMALCIIRSAIKNGRFDPADVAVRFLAWLDTAPRDVGLTTRTTLLEMRNDIPWHYAALGDFHRNPGNAANGSLMRNGVVPALADSLVDAFRITIQHGIITHYAPLPVLCCAAQTWWIWRALEGAAPVTAEWLEPFLSSFQQFLNTNSDPIVNQWHEVVKKSMPDAIETLRRAEWSADAFNPFDVSYSHRAGYCLLTLQIALWAAHWAKRNAPFPTPPGFPAEPFHRTGPWTLSWVAMIGHDSDTYGAAAGPMIAAAVGEVPNELKEGLQVAIEVI